MEILKFIYYGLGIWFAYYHHKTFVTFKSFNDGIKALRELGVDLKSKNNDLKKIDLQYHPDILIFLKIIYRKAIISLLFVLWMLVGLFSSSQWIYFAIVFLTNAIIIDPLIRIFDFKKMENSKLVLQKTSVILFWIISMFVPLNAWFFKIDSDTFIKFIT